MKAAEFRKWQKRMGYTNPKAAQELAVTERMITYYRNGGGQIGAQTARLCELIDQLAKCAKDLATKG